MIKSIHKKAYIFIMVTLLLAIVIFVVSVCVGASNISFKEALSAILGQGSTQARVILELRIKRALAAFFCGASLAVAGTCLQGIFANPMADPQVLGVTSGAGLGATVALLVGSAGLVGQLGVTGAAIIGGILSTAFVFVISGGGRSTLALLLSGIAVTSFLTAVIFCIMTLNRDKMDQVVLWTMGGFGTTSNIKLFALIPVSVITSTGCLAFARDLNIITAGDEEAFHMGVNVRSLRIWMLLLTAALTAASVAVGGMIGFVGLMVPHMVRRIIGPDHTTLIPASFVAGGAFLLLMDTLSRTVVSPIEVPVGILTSLFGVPFFLYLLKKR